MFRRDAINFHDRVDGPAFTIRAITPGADPFVDANNELIVTKFLLVTAAGTVTFTDLTGTSRTFTTLAGMAYPVRLDVFASHVTASTVTVYGGF